MLNNLFHLFHFEYLLNPSTFVISILAIGIPLFWIMRSDRPNHFRPIPLTTGNQSRGRTGGRGRGQFFPRPLPIHSVVRPRIPPEDRHPITNTNNGGDGGHNQDSEEEESDLEENNHMENNPAIESDKANEVKSGTILSIALTLHSLGIPYEVVDIILDFAECWCVKQHSQMTKLVNGFQNANDMVLSLGPTVGRAGIGENMVKKIEFWCDSHDQGKKKNAIELFFSFFFPFSYPLFFIFVYRLNRRIQILTF